MRHIATLVTCRALLAGVLLLGGCAADEGSQLDTIAPSSDSVSPLPTLPATTASTTTEVVTEATLPDGVVGLSADGPWKLVDSAPGITTPGLVYELMPGLWVYLPLVEDIANGITWTFNEEDRPIIEGYLQARLVYYQAVTSNPIDLGLTGWSDWYVDQGADYFSRLTTRKAEGQVVDMDAGVVLRPQVIGDGRSDSNATVVDCLLDGAVFRMSDGSLAPGSTPGVLPYGSAARLEFVNDHWLIARVTQQPEVCE